MSGGCKERAWHSQVGNAVRLRCHKMTPATTWLERTWNSRDITLFFTLGAFGASLSSPAQVPAGRISIVAARRPAGIHSPPASVEGTPRREARCEYPGITMSD